MAAEQHEKDLEAEDAFKSLMFGQAFMQGNRELFQLLYPADMGLTPEQEAEIEWEIPETQEDMEAMLAELFEVMPVIGDQ